MDYVGIQAQQSRNNFRSTLLLLMFPVLVLVLVYAFFHIFTAVNLEANEMAFDMFIQTAPMVLLGVAIWFGIAYSFNASIIRSATQAHQLDRRRNMRVYNLVENLCISQGMDLPMINVIEDGALNAFASGINKKSYTITLTRGIINHLDDAELEGVIAHELTHIRNRDVRLLIISIVFVGIFTFVSQVAIRVAFNSSWGNNRKDKGAIMVVMLLIALLGVIGYFFSLLIRFAISRKREYMADAGAAQMTRQPLALASALRKITSNSTISNVTRNDVAQLFIEHSAKSNFMGLFATHPPIEKRIEVLEQF